MKKDPLLRKRIRRLPKEGWSWIGRRFLREEASSIGRDAIFLYFFLCAVSDKNGVSYYGETAIATRLRLSEQSVVRARQELEARDLIAYRTPLYQVLSLPDRGPGRTSSSSGPTLLGDLMEQLARGSRRREDQQRP